ncbi:MAG: HEAT repeat domain-containing protein [Cyanophyceae cyanobacterium]
MSSNDDIGLLNLNDSFGSPLDLPAIEAPAINPDEMLALLGSTDAAQRTSAARAFCEIQDDRAVAPLIALLRDPCPLVRVSASYGLGRNTSPDAVEPLIALLNEDWNGYVRKGAVWALGNCRDRRALEPLIRTLQGDIAAVRLWAASALGQMGHAGYGAIVAAVPPLIVGLRQDAVSAVRSNCAWSLGQLCSDLPSNAIYAGAVDGLIEALVEDEELGIKEDARAALLKLGDSRALQLIEELEREGWL